MFCLWMPMVWQEEDLEPMVWLEEDLEPLFWLEDFVPVFWLERMLLILTMTHHVQVNFWL